VHKIKRQLGSNFKEITDTIYYTIEFTITMHFLYIFKLLYILYGLLHCIFCCKKKGDMESVICVQLEVTQKISDALYAPFCYFPFVYCKFVARGENDNRSIDNRGDFSRYISIPRSINDNRSIVTEIKIYKFYNINSKRIKQILIDLFVEENKESY